MHYDCSRVGAALTMKQSFSHIFACLVQIPLVFEVAHGDLNHLSFGSAPIVKATIFVVAFFNQP
jgi:hypothetical protein